MVGGLVSCIFSQVSSRFGRSQTPAARSRVASMELGAWRQLRRRAFAREFPGGRGRDLSPGFDQTRGEIDPVLT